MRKNIKVFAYLLLLSVMFVQLPIFSAGAKEAEEYNSILVQLGILDDSIADSDELVTRAEFCIYVSDILTWNGKNSIKPATEQIFSDVSQWDYLAQQLNLLYDMGIISGYGDGTFRPDEPIDICSAYSVALNALGYKSFASMVGEYPKSVTDAAKRCGLDKDLGGYRNDAKMTKKAAAILLDNLIMTEVMSLSGESGGNIDYKTGDIFLNDYMEIYEYEGILTGTEGISVYGNFVDRGYIEIDGTVYENAAENAEKYFGCRITYYLDQTGGDTGDVLAIIPKRNNTVLEVESEQAADISGSEFRFEKDNRSKSVRISPVADIIVNGVPKKGSEAFIPEYGKIRLVDNNDDGSYDVVIISDYITVIVETADVSQNIIYGKNNDKDGHKYVFELDDYDYASIKNSDGEEEKLENIGTETVLTGTVSENCIAFIHSQTKIQGQISAVENQSEGLTDVKIDGTSYKIIKNAFLENGTISVSVTGEFLIDCNGKIAGAIISKNGAWKFGYLIRACIDDNDEVRIKLLTEAGVVEEKSCADAFQVEGEKVTDYSLAVAAINTPQLIRYRMKKDKIAAIDCAKDQPMADFAGAGSASDSLLRRSYAPMQYKPSESTFKQRGIKSDISHISNIPNADIINGEVRITPNTLIFQIPSDAEKARDNDYTVMKKSSLTANMQCDAAGYNTSAEMLEAEAVVLYYDDIQVKNSARLFIVENVTEAMYDDEITYKLEGLYSGSDSEGTLKSADVRTVDGRVIDKGDIIRTRQDAKGVISNIELIYSPDAKKGGLAVTNPWKPDNVVGTSFDVEMRCLMGTVEKKHNSMIVFKYGPKEITELMDISRAVIYVQESEPESKQRTSIGTIGDIEEGAGLIISTRTSAPTEVIVLK
ncbi:MAG: S-layer homology domain-containing protein [Clostridia bacterium]|nr:S-layer homology domain-containing protein [Clostridia bacterium]